VADALPGASLLARHGGDEFLAVVTGPALDDAGIERCARTLLDHLSTPITIGEVDLDVTASIGVSVSPDAAASAVELLAHADSAMYRAKRSGGGGVDRYSSSTDDTRRRMTLTTKLRRAIAEEAIDVHYQPIVDLPTGRLCKVEARRPTCATTASSPRSTPRSPGTRSIRRAWRSSSPSPRSWRSSRGRSR
jgi:predicted signal transduction protein with EAL and GGDEF domain